MNETKFLKFQAPTGAHEVKMRACTSKHAHVSTKNFTKLVLEVKYCLMSFFKFHKDLICRDICNIVLIVLIIIFNASFIFIQKVILNTLEFMISYLKDTTNWIMYCPALRVLCQCVNL